MCGFLLEGDEGGVPANKQRTLPFPKPCTSHVKEITLCHVYDSLSVGVVTLQYQPSPLQLGFKVWDPMDFPVPGFPGVSTTNLSLGDTTTVPLHSSCKSLSKTFEIQRGVPQI